MLVAAGRAIFANKPGGRQCALLQLWSAFSSLPQPTMSLRRERHTFMVQIHNAGAGAIAADIGFSTVLVARPFVRDAHHAMLPKRQGPGRERFVLVSYSGGVAIVPARPWRAGAVCPDPLGGSEDRSGPDAACSAGNTQERIRSRHCVHFLRALSRLHTSPVGIAFLALLTGMNAGRLREVIQRRVSLTWQASRSLMARRSGIQFADKDLRQHENLRRFPVILDYSVIQYDREAL
jgi:hypothetical protein